jgi:hypothetical protein
MSGENDNIRTEMLEKNTLIIENLINIIENNINIDIKIIRNAT